MKNEDHPFPPNPVYVRRLDESRTIGADGLVGMVIGHNENDIGPFETGLLTTSLLPGKKR